VILGSTGAAPIRRAIVRASAMRVGVVAAAIVLAPAAMQAQAVTASALKAAFLLNFAQFVEWTADVVPAGSPVVLCVVSDTAVAEALEATTKGRAVSGHELSVRRLPSDGSTRACQALFLSSDEPKLAEMIGAVKGAAIFTVSDRVGFANTGGMVELFLEHGRMRFAVNVDALERSHVRLSSRVLGLAKIVRDGDVH
jgi:uncharacterized protein DUF4154